MHRNTSRSSTERQNATEACAPASGAAGPSTPTAEALSWPTRLLLTLVPLLVLGGLAGWLWQAGLLEGEALHQWAAELGWLGPVALMATMVLAVIIGPIPTVPITVSAGMLYGPMLGVVYAMAGALVGAWASFWIARLLGRPVVERLVGGHINFCRECSDRTLFWVVFGARLVPVVSFALVSYGAGLTAMGQGAFLLATGLGMIPMTALYVAAGTNLTAGHVWYAVAGVVVLAALLVLPRWLETRRIGVAAHDQARQPGKAPE
ncbi:TVP38/TMEM64 family protein [Aquisalimonas sp.]|uniref:TVP38/TMEM64 family protein n=1 Tax=Aquisalimonas sp. TaxID=1872621 RepID=UPI0025BAE9CF|nr:TVP38/TMEM64 family protein [Aquisalimonas sp.]